MRSHFSKSADSSNALKIGIVLLAIEGCTRFVGLEVADKGSLDDAVVQTCLRDLTAVC